MKKYFMKGTDDEVREGDVIEVTLVGEEDGVTKHEHLEIKFNEAYAADLLEEDIIEEREIEDEDEDLEDFDDLTMFKEAVADDIEELNSKLAALEKKVAKLEEAIKPGKLKKK